MRRRGRWRAVSQPAVVLKAKSVVEGLGARSKVGLSELPLSLVMATIVILAPALWPRLLESPLFLTGVALHAVILVLSFAVPWDRLRPHAYLIIPLLDFVALGFSRNGAVDSLPGLGVLAIFPVLWISASGSIPVLGLLTSFICPFLIVAAPELLRLPDTNFQPFATALLLGVMMLTVSLSIYFASVVSRHNERQLADRDAEVVMLLAESREQERLLKTILNTIDVGLMAIDKDGRSILRNRQQEWFDALTRNPSTAGGTAPALVFGSDRTTPIEQDRLPLKRAQAGESFADYLVWIGPPEEQRALSVGARSMTDQDGSFTGAVLVSSDVTDMVEAMSAKDDFVSTVSHEFWTPLTSILGHLDLAVEHESALPQEVIQYLDVARRNTDRLYALVSDLLQTASAARNMHLKPTDLTSLADTSVQSARPHAASAGVALDMDVPEALWPCSEPLRMRQVLDNPISNALKYSDDGGHVIVRLQEDDDVARLQVEDVGMGMTDVETTMVFNKFFRTTAARQSSIPGVGLGLAITKAIIDGHGGTIGCSSTPGAGTTFTVTLPLRSPNSN